MLAEEMGQTIPLNVGALCKMERPLGGRPHIADPQGKRKYVLQTQNNNAKKDSPALKQKRKVADQDCGPSPKRQNLVEKPMVEKQVEKQIVVAKDHKLAKALAQQIIFLIGPKIAIIHICQELMSQWLSLGSEATYKSTQFDVSTPTKTVDLQAQLEKAMIINQDSIGRTLLRKIASISGAPDQVKLTLILSKTPQCDALDFGTLLPFFLHLERLTISELARVFSGVLPSVSSNQGSLSLSSSSQSLHLNALMNGNHGNVKRLQLMYEVLYPLLDGVSEPYPPFNETPELTAAIRNFLDYVNADTVMCLVTALGKL
ncbi:hypothetical protein EDD18DRAFT_1367567 [Armillaria luteobubalina]|uniref:Uncharacterized protein n=1 Tax=Armillaria luteobubalina TaxID=153913 RepID=A0AA39NZT1_9AGAR|nr:hypothetical protein EDD18DRAFT_1367567 [Armillaria luteobubalina]